MKINKIKFKNLASYEGEHEIDFTREPLRSAGLYAISGDTGSGKSTILDAVCLALYHKVPRYEGCTGRIDSERIDKDATKVSGLQPDDPRNIMRRGKKESMSEVEFEMPDGTRYIALWQCHVTRNNTYADYNQNLRQIYPKKREFPNSRREFREAVINITHLSYEQFCRTVLLAQNSFATFLQADKKEKSELLEKLTGTEIYGVVSKKIFELAKESRQEIVNVKSRLDAIQQNLLSQELYVQKSEELQQQQKEAEKVKLCLEKNQKQQVWIDKNKTLKKELEQQKEALREAEEALNALSGESHNYNRYVSVLPVQPLFITHRDVKERLLREKENLEEVEKRFQIINSSVVACREQSEKALQQYAALEEQWQKKQSDFKKAHQAKGQMEEMEKVLEDIIAEQEAKQLEIKNINEQIVDVQQKQKQYEVDMQKQKQQLEALKKGEVLFQAYDKVSLMLSNFQKIHTDIDLKCQERKCADEKYTVESKQLDVIRKSRNKMQDILNNLQNKLSEERSQLPNIDFTELQRRQINMQKLSNQLDIAIHTWQRLSDSYARQKKLRDAHYRHQNRLPQLCKEFAVVEQEKNKTKQLLESAERDYLLSGRDDLMALRQRLSEGEACPICGSKSHPFHAVSELENQQLLDRMKAHCKELRENALDAEKVWQEKNEEISTLKIKMENEDYDSYTLEQQIAKDVKLWQTLDLLDESLKEVSKNCDAERRTNQLSQLKHHASEDYNRITEQVEKYNRLKQSVDQISEDISSQRAKLDLLDKELNEKNLAVNTIKDKCKSLTEYLEHRKNDCEEEFRNLSPFFSSNDWYDKWQTDSEKFIQHTDELFYCWKDTIERLNDINKEIETNNIKLSSLDERRNTILSQIKILTKRIEEKESKLNNKRDSFISIFGSADVDAVEAKMKNMKDIARAESELTKDLLYKEQENFNCAKGELEKTRTNVRLTAAEQEQKKNDLEEWIKLFNYNNLTLTYGELERLFRSDINWKEIDERLNAAKTRKEHCATLCLQAQYQHEKHIAEGKVFGNMEALTSQFLAQERQKLGDNLQQTLECIGQLKLDLQMHDKNIGYAQKELKNLKQAEEDSNEWEKLNIMFGSKSGQKFKEIAQQYTFRFLVSYANQQLKLFSPRYRLDIVPESLTLKIIDRDMLERQRYVQSLSGGETFVVSLSLALGLSNLSSDGLAIGSLFIDEGFGNLDRESLQLVMQALSNIDSTQRRKVGVISHTEQIKEQISPQIRIKKIPGGVAKSHIEIV